MPDPTLVVPPPPPSAVLPSATCATCAAPLAPTGRYCLRCGTRRAGARLDVLDALSDPAPAPAPVPPPSLPTPPAPFDALRSWPFGLIAVVLLALLIGLLAGHWISDRRASADRTGTQVIRVVPEEAR